MKHFFLPFLFILLGTPLLAQDQTYIGSFHSPDSLNAVFGSYVLDFYGSNLYTEAKKGNILLYKDEEFRNPVSLDEVDGFFMTSEMQQIINPENPDDPYDLIDTNIIGWQNPYNWLEMRIGESYVRIVPVNKEVYVKKDDFERLLYGKLIFECLANDTVLFHRGNTFGLAVQRYYDRIQWELFLKMKEQPDLVFLKMECEEKLNSSDQSWYPYMLFGLCADRENVQFQNPYNPEDPYDLIDSVITTPANSSTFIGFIFGIKSRFDGNSTLHSLSICCRCTSSFYSNLTPEAKQNLIHNLNVFYVKISDLEKLLGKDKARFITLNYIWMLSNR